MLLSRNLHIKSLSSLFYHFAYHNVIERRDVDGKKNIMSHVDHSSSSFTRSRRVDVPKAGTHTHVCAPLFLHAFTPFLLGGPEHVLASLLESTSCDHTLHLCRYLLNAALGEEHDEACGEILVVGSPRAKEAGGGARSIQLPVDPVWRMAYGVGVAVVGR